MAFRTTRLALGVTFVGGVLFGGVALWVINATTTATGQTYAVRQEGYSLISPLLDCTENEAAHNLRNLQQQVQKVVDDALARPTVEKVSVYFRDLQNGPWYGINEAARFAPASLLKVPTMIAVLKMAERNETLLDEPLQDGNGETTTVQRLLEKMIIDSDNDAFAALTRFVDFQEITTLHNTLGIPVPSAETDEDFVTVQEYAGLFRVLYNASYLNREMSERALNLLTRTTFRSGLVAGVPQGITVAHKFGERGDDSSYGQLHDCGVVYHPSQPFLLCVMTKGGPAEVLATILQDVTRAVYNGIQ